MTNTAQQSDPTRWLADLKKRVLECLVDEGIQSICQISVTLGEPLKHVAVVLHALEHDEKRVLRRELPPSLQKYQVFDSKGNPQFWLYEAIQSQAELNRRIIYRI